MIGSNVAQFPAQKHVGDRDWGEEIMAAVIPQVLTLKILNIKKGHQGGLQYHRLKQEAGVLISGKLLIRFENEHGELEERVVNNGESFFFPKGSVHQEVALEDCKIIEASTPYLNDRVRVEADFGFDSSGGLPTTSLDEIKHL